MGSICGLGLAWGEPWCEPILGCWSEVCESSASGLFGKRIAEDAGGELESRDKENDEDEGELKDVGGAEPFE